MLALAAPVAQAQDQAVLAKMASSSYSPIQKVVILLKDMQKTVQKDAEDDEAAYDKYKCYCETYDREKTEAIKNAEERIAELEAFVQEADAKIAELESTIASLEDDIEEGKDALATATALREKEHAEYELENADLSETIDLLGQAIAVLSKVQLLQKQRTSKEQTAAALVQVRGIVQKLHRSTRFKSVMQQDLFDVLGSLQALTNPQDDAFLPRRDSVALGQTSKLLPWEKTEEELGKEANPNDLVGAAAGAKSYNARSGSILGILEQMKETFEKDLASTNKKEDQAQKAFDELSAAKMGEIEAATKLKEAKEAELSDTIDKKAKANEDIEATKNALSADEQFLMTLKKNCAKVDEDYNARVKVRSEELLALSQALDILMADDVRELTAKTLSFLQLFSNEISTSSKQDRALQRAMKRIAVIANKHHNWVLASLAVRVRLDQFTKVKEMMDKMVAELEAQQKAEYEKWEFCKTAIDETEDEIKKEERTKELLADKHQDLTNTLNTLSEDIKTLKTEVADMEVSLKTAGEDRHAANTLYQSQVADQRATIVILNKVLDRLKAFYASMFVQVRVHDHTREEPMYAAGAGVAPAPPPTPAPYTKDGRGGGVLAMLDKIIQDATTEEQQMVADENDSQAAYGELVKETAASIEADRAAIAEKEEQSAATSAEISETEQAQLGNEQALEKATDLLKAHHLDCDYLIKYFDIRQKSRAEEMQAINDAKAILSGADFGTEA